MWFFPTPFIKSHTSICFPWAAMEVRWIWPQREKKTWNPWRGPLFFESVLWLVQRNLTRKLCRPKTHRLMSHKNKDPLTNPRFDESWFDPDFHSFNFLFIQKSINEHQDVEAPPSFPQKQKTKPTHPPREKGTFIHAVWTVLFSVLCFPPPKKKNETWLPFQKIPIILGGSLFLSETKKNPLWNQKFAPVNRPTPKKERDHLPLPSIFRCYVGFRKGTLPKTNTHGKVENCLTFNKEIHLKIQILQVLPIFNCHVSFFCWKMAMDFDPKFNSPSTKVLEAESSDLRPSMAGSNGSNLPGFANTPRGLHGPCLLTAYS